MQVIVLSSCANANSKVGHLGIGQHLNAAHPYLHMAMKHYMASKLKYLVTSNRSNGGAKWVGSTEDLLITAYS